MGRYDELGDAVRNTIRAYHGSPHDFDRFDASKIGTGEGNQAYGHGLYFAGNEDVARGYRNALKWRGWDTGDAARRATQWVEKSGSRDSAIDALMANINQLSATVGRNSLSARLNEEAIKYLQSGGDLPPAPSGRMYEVEIDAPEGQLLDLDLPVQSQSPVVQDALGKYVEAPSWFSLGQEGWVGKNAYMRMAGDMAAANPRIAGGYHVVHDQPAASAALLQGGVPGIRYLDQGARSAGEGTRNYVMFPGTEDSIRILRKFGIMAPIAAGAAAGGEE
jgi:hypothetical protein